MANGRRGYHPPFFRCPACGKKGVQFHFGKTVQGVNQDYLSCRYCDDFSAFANPDSDMDRSYLWALAKANPGREEEIPGLTEYEPQWPGYLSEPEPWLRKYVKWEKDPDAPKREACIECGLMWVNEAGTKCKECRG